MDVASDVKTAVAGVELAHPVMNAAGTCKRIEDVSAFAQSESAAVVLGSITLSPRTGNPEGLTGALVTDPHYSLNKLELPNPGRNWYRQNLPAMRLATENAKKPLIISVAGFSEDEFSELAAMAADRQADLIELDFGSMTVEEHGVWNRILTFEKLPMRSILKRVQREVDDIPIGLKLSPISDPYHLMELSGWLNGIKPDFVTTSNTFANGGAARTADIPYGGVGGPGFKPIALGQAEQFRDCLIDSIDVIGVGGISSADDVLDYLNVGVSAVQLATAFFQRERDTQDGYQVFGDIVAELKTRYQTGS